MYMKRARAAPELPAGAEADGAEWMTSREVAKLTGNPPATILSYVRRRLIPFYRFGTKTIRYRRSEILAWIENAKGK